MLSIGYGYSIFHSIGIPKFDRLIASNKIIKKTRVYFGVICVHYIIAFICAYNSTCCSLDIDISTTQYLFASRVNFSFV